MRIYLVRHGESEGNKDRSYHGSSDYSLSDRGREQVKELKKVLYNENVSNKKTKVYSSSRKRTLETAEGLSLGHVQIDDRLTERDFGIFEGLNYQEIKEQYPRECEAWEGDWMNFTPENGESHMSVCKRVFEFMDEIRENKASKENEEDIILITHGGIIRAIYCYIMDRREELFWKFACGNCHMGVIKFEYGNFYLERMTEL